jgi:hypothetical protein
MPTSIKYLNYFRPAGLPLSNAAIEQKSHQFELLIRSLLRQITEAMCRVLLPERSAKSSTTLEHAPKVTIFLSHAKQDGTLPAKRIRDHIYSQTQLAAFYDENDIAFGSGFARTIEEVLMSMSTAAMILVRSAISSRAWCRRELSQFRRPHLERLEESGGERWRLFSTLVVEAMVGSESSSGIANLGNSPIIRWSDGDQDIAELIVTSVIRDACSPRSIRLWEEHQGREEPDRHQLAARSYDAPADSRGSLGLRAYLVLSWPRIVHARTRHSLRFFSHRDPPPVRGSLVVNPSKYRRQRLLRPLPIAFLISYERADLLARGLGLEHLRELLIRLARPILRCGASLAYGGNWEEREDNFTYDLPTLISAEQNDQEDDVLGGRRPLWTSKFSIITPRGLIISGFPDGSRRNGSMPAGLSG